jgi:hypothetical protein
MTKPHDEPAPTRQEVISAKVTGAYATAVDKASSTTKDVIATVEGNPLVALLGGLALGAAIGSLLPRSDKEKAMLAPLGEKIGEAASAAIAAGRAAGAQAYEDSGFSADVLREQVVKLVGQATDAAGTIGTAAFEAARDKVQS